MIQDKDILTYSGLSYYDERIKDYIDTSVDGKQDTLIPGDGVKIESDNTIKANTSASTVSDIVLTNGAPIDALGIWENNTIPMGTSVQEILEKLLNREIFPSKATKPDFTVSGEKFGVVEFDTEVTVHEPSITNSNGTFNAPFQSPAQPKPTGVAWTLISISSEVISGFIGQSGVKTVILGDNKITYTVTKKYTEPSNMPITNLGNATRSTTEVTTATTEYSAIWTSGQTTHTEDITATGVYPCFTNISGDTLVDDTKAEKCPLTAGNTIEILNIPDSHSALSGFTFAFPADRTYEIKSKDISGNWIEYTGTKTEIEMNDFYKGTKYKIVSTGTEWGPGMDFQFILSIPLNKNANN